MIRAAKFIAACVLLGSSPLAVADDRPPACEIVPASLVGDVVGRSVRAVEKDVSSGNAQRHTCTYSDGKFALTLSVIHAESEVAARKRFGNELQRRLSDGASVQALRGVGAEAQYLKFAGANGSVIVSRFGTIVLILQGTADQETLVNLARAAAARL